MKSIDALKVSALLFLSVALYSCGGHQKEEGKEEKPVETEAVVQTAQVELLQPENDVVLPGDLKPWQETKIFAKVQGFVRQLNVDRGSVVKKGDVLMELEAPELVAELNNEQAKIAEYKSRYAASKATYYRILQTSQTAGAVSANEVEVAQSKMLADSALVSSTQASLQARRAIVSYLRVTAPFDGIITERNVSPGALVGPSSTVPMLVLKDNKKLRLTVAIPERYSSELESKSQVTFNVSAFPDKKFTAVLARDAESLNENVRAMMTEFDVQNENLELKAGMYADVDIPVKRTAPTTFVPASAIVNSTEQVYVEKIEDGHAKRVKIATGVNVDGKVEVFGDLKAGDVIISNASEEIRDGQTVKIGAAAPETSEAKVVKTSH